MNDISKREQNNHDCNPHTYKGACASIRRPLTVLSLRTVQRNDRLVTESLIDGSRDFGRGYCFWLSSGAASMNGKMKIARGVQKTEGPYRAAKCGNAGDLYGIEFQGRIVIHADMPLWKAEDLAQLLNYAAAEDVKKEAK